MVPLPAPLRLMQRFTVLRVEVVCADDDAVVRPATNRQAARAAARWRKRTSGDN
jgi:virulence-associated protein VagC